jgi:hypothetical protein
MTFYFFVGGLPVNKSFFLEDFFLRVDSCQRAETFVEEKKKTLGVQNQQTIKKRSYKTL